MKNKLIESVEAAFSNKEIPEFRSGDTVKVHFRIKEGTKERVQIYEGLVIKVHNNSSNSTFTVRKMVGDIGVERIFPFYSPKIDKVELVRKGRVRQARLYYMRELRGKAARIKERRKGF
ncbi:MAG: 50S ribosomal protein L19 [Denitrovibrio sp.]|nr:MAG: 50S ribosomal protein L19 [Denitrovibrio sp.]